MLYGKDVYGFCLRLARNKDNADDLYQETFLKAIELSNRIDKSKNPKGFLVSIAVGLWKIMSGSVFAVWQLLSPKQVAENLGDKALEEAFSSEDAIQINKSITSGDYTFTLLGITSGKNLTDLKSSVQDINSDRTYAVVSIAKKRWKSNA